MPPLYIRYHPTIHAVLKAQLRTLATWLTLSQFYPYYRATLITPLLKICAVNMFNNIHVTGPIYKHWHTMHTQPLRFASVVCGAFASLLQSGVTFCQWLSKRDSGILTEAGSLLEPRLWESGIWSSRPQSRCLQMPDSLKEWNRGSDSQFGIG